MAQLVLAIPAAEALGAHLRSMDCAACSFIGISHTRDTFLGGPKRIILFLGLYWVALMLGNYLTCPSASDIRKL